MINPPTVDTHAHVWDNTCRHVEGARHSPDYQAPLAAYLRLLDAHGIARAVLVQPSFLGTDNSYMMAACDAHPDRLRAIVVVPPEISDAQLDDLTARGAIGLRYNMIGRDPALPATPDWQALTRRASQRGWWIEVHATGSDWRTLLPAFPDARLMIDHFGRPDDPACPGLGAIMQRDPARTCVKLSAPYRQTTPGIAPLARTLIERFGADRMLWGSDWPWTQNEGRHDYAQCIEWLARWTTASERRRLGTAIPLF